VIIADSASSTAAAGFAAAVGCLFQALTRRLYGVAATPSDKSIPLNFGAERLESLEQG
jgi:hypothetical protein